MRDDEVGKPDDIEALVYCQLREALGLEVVPVHQLGGEPATSVASARYKL